MGCIKNLWTPVRDTVESAASLAGNYFLPGSSLLTDNLVSKGSQAQLNSPIGKIAQIGSGLAGSGIGSSLTGIPSASEVGGGWTNIANDAGGLVGDASLGTDIASGVSGAVNSATGAIGDALSGAGNAIGLTGGDSAASSPGFFSNLFGSGAAPTGIDTTGDASFLNSAGNAAGTSGLSPADNGFLSSAAKSSGLASSPVPISAGGGASAFGGSGSGMSPLTLGTSLLGAANTLNANDQAKKDLLAAQGQALGAIAPYSASGTAANAKLSDLLGTSGNTGASGYGSLTTPFTPGDLTQTPGYQFQLQQGDQALDRKAAASGDYFSGSALKAAQDYGQGLAGETYNTAFNQDAQNKQQLYSQLSGQAGAGQTAANTIGNIDTGTGNANAAAGISSANILNNTLSSLLSSSGARKPVYGASGQIIGYA